ncbi:unnamed protein product, partial [Adineta steineri]
IQQIQSSTPHTSSSPSSSVTMSSTPSSSTATTGYLGLLRMGRAPMASPDPLSLTSDESCQTPDLELL